MLADADAYLLAARYWKGSDQSLSSALSALRSVSSETRILEFYQTRFASSADNVKKAFWNLLSSWTGITIPAIGGPLTWAAHAHRLPTREEADQLASVYAQCLSRG